MGLIELLGGIPRSDLDMLYSVAFAHALDTKDKKLNQTLREFAELWGYDFSETLHPLYQVRGMKL